MPICVALIYNVIRTVEETFKTLKADLDIRPFFHKSDDGTKAHLHLAILAYWVVSTARYILKRVGAAATMQSPSNHCFGTQTIQGDSARMA